MKCPHCGGTVAVALRSVGVTEAKPAEPKPTSAEPTAKEKRLARIAKRKEAEPWPDDWAGKIKPK